MKKEENKKEVQRTGALLCSPLVKSWSASDIQDYINYA